MGQQEKNRHQRVGTSELGVYRSSGERSIMIPGIAAAESSGREVRGPSFCGGSIRVFRDIACGMYLRRAGKRY